MDRSLAGWAAGLVTVSLALAVTGCRPAALSGGGAPAPAPQPEERDAPKGEAVADPALREARDQADAILGDLLAGKLDNDSGLSPVARKVKGYQSCSIKSQKIVRGGAVDFRGVLTGPAGRARIDMTLVKQVSGKWAIGTFSGPDSE
jgi:hypothetical protein